MKSREGWHKIWDMVVAQFDIKDSSLIIVVKIAVIIFSAFLIYLAGKWVLKIISNKLKRHKFINENENAIIPINQGFKYILILATGMFLIEFLKLYFIKNIFFALMILLFVLPVKGLILTAISFLKKNFVQKTDTKIDDIVFDILERFSGIILYIIAIMLALDLIGINVMPFIAGAGVLGIAIGFAAKDTLSNLIAGVLLLIDRPFEVGDRIEIWQAPAGSATWGDVISIGMRATKIKTTDNIVVIIPNNEIMIRDIVNYTAGSDAIRVRINIGVAYNTDIVLAKKIILNVADGADWIMKEPLPKVVVKNFGESSIDLQARVWIYDARKRMDTISYITDKVKEVFDLSGVEIPFPRRDIIIRNEKS